MLPDIISLSLATQDFSLPTFSELLQAEVDSGDDVQKPVTKHAEFAPNSPEA